MDVFLDQDMCSVRESEALNMKQVIRFLAR